MFGKAELDSKVLFLKSPHFKHPSLKTALDKAFEHSESYSGCFRYGFNGKEKDNQGLGGGQCTYDYGFRIYNAALGKFLSVDPLTKKYPELTTYQFASNRCIDGIDLDGLEFYYTANGALIGSIGTSTEVRVIDEGYVKSVYLNINLANTTTDEGWQKNCLDYANAHTQFVDSDHSDFLFQASVLYAEADGTSSDAVDEVAGIYSVLENRANYEGTTVSDQMTVSKGVYGATDTDKIDQADNTGMSDKKNAVFSGLIKGKLSETDFSNGAFYWDGIDFKNGGGHTERYNPGYLFTDKNHDLFGLGSKMKSGTANGVTWNYKYQSTGAIGNTTFSKLTDEWRDAQYPAEGKAKELGQGKE